MLSYQHIYHAGCRADLHKHMALAQILARMTAKDKPLTYIETHAGRGLYDLNAPEAQKTGEAQEGIVQALADGRIPENHPFMRALGAVRQARGESAYPGSPLIAAHFMRPDDRMHLMELHPQEFTHLQGAMKGTGAKLYRREGLEGLLALAPPTPRRGLVLIDPSYELKQEYAALPEAIGKLMRKWPVAVLALWYPLLPAGLHRAMIEALLALDLPKNTIHEAVFSRPDLQKDNPRGMYGSGLFIANTPYGLSEDLAALETGL